MLNLFVKTMLSNTFLKNEIIIWFVCVRVFSQMTHKLLQLVSFLYTLRARLKFLITTAVNRKFCRYFCPNDDLLTIADFCLKLLTFLHKISLWHLEKLRLLVLETYARTETILHHHSQLSNCCTTAKESKFLHFTGTYEENWILPKFSQAQELFLP